METRSDWHAVYMDLNVFVEYAANNPSSAMIFIWALEAPVLEHCIIRTAVSSGSEQLLAETFRFVAFLEPDCPCGHIARANSSTLGVIPVWRLTRRRISGGLSDRHYA